jgi:hypothetical protein
MIAGGGTSGGNVDQADGKGGNVRKLGGAGRHGGSGSAAT